jgi:molybdopterin-guanine dinucleotide biosynthesis protein A
MTLSAILIAGGFSRRMGVDKATLLVAGKPLWQRQLEVLSGMRPAALWVSARGALPWCPPGIEIVVDRAPSRGPLSGVAAALCRLRTSHLLVLAVDLPQMTTEHLRKLWSLSQPGTGVIPLNGGYFEPLCAVYPVEAAAIAEAALNSMDLSLQSFAQTLRSRARTHVYDLTPEEQPFYLNMNTPSDLLSKRGAGSR